MSPDAARFGFCVPVFANPGAAFFRAPAWRELDGPAAGGSISTVRKE